MFVAGKGQNEALFLGYWKTMRGSARLTSTRRKIMLIFAFYFVGTGDLARAAAAAPPAAQDARATRNCR